MIKAEDSREIPVFRAEPTARPEENSPLRRGAQVFSFVFHPFFMPLIGVVLMLFGHTFLNIMPLSMKYYILTVILLTTLFFPAMSIWILRRFNILTDLSLTNQSDRVVPLIVVAVGYMLCAWMLSGHLMVQLMYRILYAAVASILICFTINFYWKISLHMTAIGGLVGLLLTVNQLGYGAMFWSMIAFILLAGILGSARLYLKRHTLWQVAAGFSVGFFLMVATLRLF